MNKRMVAKYDCFNSIRAFALAHTDLFPPAGFAGELFAEMARIVTRLEELSATQASSLGASRRGTSIKEATRKELEIMIDSLNRAAASMAVSTPGAEDKFRRPRRGRSSALLTAARAALSDAEPMKAEFIKFGMGADFLERLQHLIAEFEEAVNDRHNKAQARVSATAGLNEAIQQGLKLRRKLNGIVRNTLQDHSTELAAWETAHHIEQAPRKQTSRTPDAAKSKAAEPADKPKTAQ